MACGNQLGNEFEPLGRQLAAKPAHAGDVPAWPSETGDKAGRYGVAADGDGNPLSCRFRRAWRSAAKRHDHVHLAAGEIGGQCPYVARELQAAIWPSCREA